MKLPKSFIILTNSSRQENQRPSVLITSVLLYCQTRNQKKQHATVVRVTRGCKVTGSAEDFTELLLGGF